MKVYLIRVTGLMESPHSWSKVPFEATLVEKVKRDYVSLNPNSLRQKYKKRGFSVLWIYDPIKRLTL